MKDLYKTLGVAENADQAAIKKAYRKLAKEFHPDVTGNDKKKTERFKEINDAYDVLGDKEKRAEYERLKHAPVRPDGMPEGFDADAFARTFGGMRGRGGAGFAGGRPRQARGADVIGTLPLTFAEAALGTRRSVRSGGGSTVEVSVPAASRRAAACACPDTASPRPA